MSASRQARGDAAKKAAKRAAKARAGESDRLRLAYAWALLAAAVCFAAAVLLPKARARTRVLEPVFSPSGESGPLDSSAASERMRLATYNTCNFTDGKGDGPERTGALAASHIAGVASVLDAAAADVVVLEEVENAAMLAFLNDRLEKPFACGYATRLRHASGRRDKLNLALLARFPPEEVREISFAGMDYGDARPTRGAICARFDLGEGRKLAVYGVHLKSNYGDAPRNEAERTIALAAIAADAAAERMRLATGQGTAARLSVVVLGDFNTDPENAPFAEDPSLEPLAGGFADLWRGRPLGERTTIPMRHGGGPELEFPDACFDRVFASKDLCGEGNWRIGQPEAVRLGVATEDATALPGERGHVSDHYAVTVDLVRN